MLKNHRSPQKFEQQSKAMFLTAMWLDFKISLLNTPFYIDWRVKLLGLESKTIRKEPSPAHFEPQTLSSSGPKTKFAFLQVPIDTLHSKIQSMYFLFVPSFFTHLIDCSLESTKRFSIIFWPCGVLLYKLHIKTLIVSVFVRSFANTNNVATVYTYFIDLIFDYAVRLMIASNSQLHVCRHFHISTSWGHSIDPATSSMSVCVLSFFGVEFCCDSMYCSL